MTHLLQLSLNAGAPFGLSERLCQHTLEVG
jgi:hypothetical protein